MQTPILDSDSVSVFLHIMKQSQIIAAFTLYLQKEGLSANTLHSYISTIEYYLSRYPFPPSDQDLLAYKGYLLTRYKPKTVNLRIQALNRFLDFENLSSMRIKSIKLQEKTFLENVISDADYRFFKKRLFADHNEDLAMAVWFLGATGARVSELLQFKAEHVQCGYIDLTTKGGKLRRIFIPQHLAREAASWLDRRHITSGYIFLNRQNQRITARGLSEKLRYAARKYHLNVKHVHPHSFRHRFAKNFLEKYLDIALLADLMGHESIETTRIYLRRTSTEQQTLVNQIVDW